MQSTPLDVSFVPVSLSAPPGWEAVNTTTTEGENQSSPPPLLVSTSSILWTLLRWQLNPPTGPSEGEDAWEPQIYKLDFYPFTPHSFALTHQPRRCWLCGLRARCNYHHLCQSCITRDGPASSSGSSDAVANEWAAWSRSYLLNMKYCKILSRSSTENITSLRLKQQLLTVPTLLPVL